MKLEDTSKPAGRSYRMSLTLAVAILVGIVTLWAQARVGAGVYYDDGAYLALARALAQGDGYVYSNLPEPVPGVKYPPAYPFVLAAAWRLMGSYPENLPALKGLNALLAGIAAAFTFSLFATGGRRRLVITAVVTAFTFVAVPTLSITTVLLSEPLFMLVIAGALLVAGHAGRAGEVRRPVPHREGWLALAAGLLAGLAFFTRTAGLAVVAAVPASLLLRRRWRSGALAAAAALLPTVAWIAWSSARAGDVPETIVGQYGSYANWLLPGGGSEITGLPARLLQIAESNWVPFIETLTFVWIPRAPEAAALFVILVLGVAAVYGLWRAASRNPALAVFPFLYLPLVFMWPYEPYRFLYTVLPLLTLAVLEGLLEAWPRIRPDLARWNLPVAIVAGGMLMLNTLEYQARGLWKRSWQPPQRIPASAYAPLNEWIRTNTRRDEVIASGLDPFIHWETGRPAVPSWRFLADDYGRYDRSPEVLAADLDSILARFQPSYVALIPGETKAAETLAAFVELHPDRAAKVYESEETAFPGVIYRVAPPGGSLRAPEGTSSPGEVSPPSPR